MKYKNIDAMLHNYGHSFVSGMNYVDGEHIIELLPDLAYRSPGLELDINFTQNSISPPGDYPSNLVKSVSYYHDGLVKHVENHKVEFNRLSDIHLRFRLLQSGHEIIVSTTDDRGISHKVFVHA